MKTVDISTLDKLNEFSKEFISNLTEPSVLLLNGDLSAGKTQFVKYCLAHLGLSEEEVSSPSYSIINTYNVGDKSVYHIDLYRVESAEELEQIGFWDLFESYFSYVFVEWADKFDIKLVHSSKVLHFRKVLENNRQVVLSDLN